jgi:hypothetical protein
VHGHSRTGELRDGIGQGTGLVVERHSRITGYASAFGCLGHAVDESNLARPDGRAFLLSLDDAIHREISVADLPN